MQTKGSVQDMQQYASTVYPHLEQQFNGVMQQPVQQQPAQQQSNPMAAMMNGGNPMQAMMQNFTQQMGGMAGGMFGKR